MFNCNAYQTPSNTQSPRKKTRKAGLLVLLAVLVINMTVILPIQHGCEIPKSAANLSETCSATELAMQHTIRSQICTSFLLLPLYPHYLSLPKNTSLPLIDYLQALTNYSGSRRTRERKKKETKE